MKRFLSVLAVAGLLMGFASCSKDDEPTPTPPPVDKDEVIADLFGSVGNAPDFVTGDQTQAISVEEGGVVNIGTFKAVYPWKAEVTSMLSPKARAAISRAEAEGYKFALSQNADGSNPQQEISGAATNDEVTLYLVTPSAPGYGEGNVEGDVTLVVNTDSNNTQTFVLYKAYVGEEDLNFFLYTAEFDGYEFVYNEDPSSNDMYQYEPVDYDIELYYATGSAWYQVPVKIVSDLSVDIKTVPEWIQEVKLTTNDDVTTFFLRAVTTKIEDPTGEIVFIATGSEKEYTLTYNVTIPNYGEVQTLVSQSMHFDYAGNPVQTATSLGRPTVNWTGTSDYTVYYFEYSDSDGVYNLVDTPSWYNVAITNDSEPDAYLQDLTATVTVDENTTLTSRKGAVVIMPFYGFDQLSEQLGETVSEETFKVGLPENMFNLLGSFLLGSIEQDAMPALSITSEQYEEYADVGAYFENSPADAWFKNNMNIGQAGSFYELIYTSPYNNVDHILLTPAPGLSNITFKYYDGDGNEELQAYNEENPVQGNWLEASVTGAGITIAMYPNYDTFVSPDYAHEGFVMVLSDGTPAAAIHCIYDESLGSSNNPGTGGDSDGLVSFVNASAVDGATLLQITEYGEIAQLVGMSETEYNEALGMGTQLYVLVYSEATPTNATLNVPSGLMITYQPFNISWLSSEYEYGEYSGSTMLVNMEKPEEDDPQIGLINFQKMSGNYEIAATIYCVPDFE